MTKKTKPNRFDIDFFEFSFLVEACIPPAPIARSMFFDKVVNEYYHVLTNNERKRLYEWIMRNPRMQNDGDDWGVEMRSAFKARYNPDNQYLVTVCDGDIVDERECFLMNDIYYTYYGSAKKQYAPKEYITRVVKIENKD